MVEMVVAVVCGEGEVEWILIRRFTGSVIPETWRVVGSSCVCMCVYMCVLGGGGGGE